MPAAPPNDESEKIRNFLERRNPYDVLAKSENGRQNLERVFTKLIRFLAGRDLAVTVLIDLDNNSLDELVRNLDTRVEDNEGRTLGVRTTDRPVRSRAQVGVVAALYSAEDNTRLDTFEILAFRDCLEAAAGIDGSDDGSTEDSKLREFVGDERATAPMRDLLL